MKRVLIQISLLFCVALVLTGCISSHVTSQQNRGKGWYTVKPTDTLYSIAWRYGLDYKELANWNQVDVNAIIYPGQKLYLLDPVSNPTVISAASQNKTEPVINKSQESGAPVDKKNTASATVSSVPTVSTNTPSGRNPEKWLWPTEGKLLNTFSAKALDRRGIDIEGEPGQAIRAVASGKVVYSGNGLAGYGNLIIIKHSETYLSAYAYSQERLVKEGMTVRAGKVIAKMGKHKSRTVRLHFQIRKNGKPVDPLRYLPKR